MTKQYTILLQNLPFTLLLLNCLIAMFGDGLTYIMMVWSLIDQNPSVNAMAILLLLYWVPSSTLGPFFGAVADKYGLKKLFLFTNGFQALILLYFGFIGKEKYSTLDMYILSASTGIFLAIYMPVLMTLVRKSVKEEMLIFANTMIDVCEEMGSVIGMACAGIFLGFLTYASFMLINGFIYLGAFLLVLGIRDAPHPIETSVAKSLLHGLMEGARYFLKNPLILIVYSIQGLLFTCLMTAPVLLAPYAKLYLHAEIAEYSWLEIALSLGVVIGGICGAWFATHFNIQQTLFVQIIVGIVSLYQFSHTQSITIGIFYQFFIGCSFASWALSTTLAQQITNIDYQTRVQSISNCLSGIIMMIFFAILHQLDHANIHWLYELEMIFLILAGSLLFFFMKWKGDA